MAVLTGAEYRESFKAFSPEIYIRGERVTDVVEHPLMRQTLAHAAAGCDLAADPANRGTYAVHSSPGGRVRLAHRPPHPGQPG